MNTPHRKQYICPLSHIIPIDVAEVIASSDEQELGLSNESAEYWANPELRTVLWGD